MDAVSSESRKAEKMMLQRPVVTAAAAPAQASRPVFTPINRQECVSSGILRPAAENSDDDGEKIMNAGAVFKGENAPVRWRTVAAREA
ncbi:hypothetical protein BJF92_01755 [Rhizobium rhizosphaerae]|uniref:Uncharacterized protein n=1 Tax=Xaviernesmea rhizosphaerae TaxID=1672749 RepID=A0A1Q9AKP9_9HYPH|nr:hypothetical protein [Xaviernesmea rhizosphaerae]OLP55865.1 hypothetical protein BJF92_01755 [Xaviernesmea rhizosphaerae]